MSRYRQLKGLAHNLAEKFSVSCEHFAHLAVTSGDLMVRIDLTEESISPGRFMSPRNRTLVEMCSRDAKAHAARLQPGTLVSTILTAAFEIGPEPGAVASRISVVITDDRSRAWTATVHRARQALSP